MRKLANLSCQSGIEKERTVSQIMGGLRTGGEYLHLWFKVIKRKDLINISDNDVIIDVRSLILVKIKFEYCMIERTILSYLIQ